MIATRITPTRVPTPIHRVGCAHARGQHAPRASAGTEPARDHFEVSPPRGECRLEDARDAMEACANKGLSPEEEAACFLQFGCDAGSVHAALDTADSDDDADVKTA